MQVESTLDNFARLSTKPGVLSTLILSKIDGAIIKSFGFQPDDEHTTPTPVTQQTSMVDESQDAHADSSRERIERDSAQSVEQTAKLVWTLISSAGDLARGLDKGDDVQLLRLRTRKNEIVINSDSKYLLVAIREPPKLT